MPRYLLVPLLLTFFGVASCAMLKPQPMAPAVPPPAPVAPPPAAAIPPAPPPSFFPPAPRPEQPYFIQEGIASFYGGAHQGKPTATGEHFNRADFTAAHPSLPFGTVVRVTNLHNGMVVKVRINDRGPHVKGRVIDLSTASARALNIWDGLARVQIQAFASDQPSAFPP
ncbi:MAG TPA: septal ring lytic transglycosylase RlpA family protein [Rhizomicrobium sp.]|jgi:rare lipoprotein A|nr:septal ring lytic transglycosylase RlpA family protein [Rhizomicrobium sp.]